ncbi:hypothetical protein ABTK13_22915, partial [Acinetobacter baumannii]
MGSIKRFFMSILCIGSYFNFFAGRYGNGPDGGCWYAILEHAFNHSEPLVAEGSMWVYRTDIFCVKEATGI